MNHTCIASPHFLLSVPISRCCIENTALGPSNHGEQEQCLKFRTRNPISRSAKQSLSSNQKSAIQATESVSVAIRSHLPTSKPL